MGTDLGAQSVEPAARGVALPFRPDVEGLRGVAILLVVAYHVGLPGFGGGFVGVDAFFVLSGYLITGLLLRELADTGTIALAAFYARRTRRLLPAAAVALLGTLALAAVLGTPAEVAASADAARAAAAFVSNLVFAARAADYFAGRADANPLLHTWSLAVEEQFYLVWPWVVLGAAGARVDRRRLGWALVTLAALSCAGCWWYTYADRPLAFYGTPLRAWEFAAGALVTLRPDAARGWGRRRLTAAAVAGWGGLALVLGAAGAFSAGTLFPGVRAIVPVAGTALVLLGAPVATGSSVARVLGARALRWVGRHSYSWYLWHWPLLVLGVGAVGPVPWAAAVPLRVALALAALGLAVATRALVEEPCRRARRFHDRPWWTLAAGAAGCVALLGGATAVGGVAAGAIRTPTQRAFTAAVHDLPRLYRDGCGASLGDSVVHACAYGAREGHVTVAVFGDSHAAHWVPALDVIARRRQWRLLVLTKSACPSVATPVADPVLQRVSPACEAWRRAALDTLRARRPALVVVSNSTEYVRDGSSDEQPAVTPAAWGQGLGRTLTALRAAGMSALVLQDTPHAPENVPACLRRAAWRGRDLRRCDFPRRDAVHAGAAAAVARAVRGVPDVRLVDPTALLCTADRCAAMQDGVVRYRDARHLTASAAAALAPALDAALDETGLQTGRMPMR